MYFIYEMDMTCTVGTNMIKKVIYDKHTNNEKNAKHVLNGYVANSLFENLIKLKLYTTTAMTFKLILNVVLFF